MRFICGTQEIHSELERRLQRVPRTQDDDPLRVVLRRQRRALRGAARRSRTRSSPTRSTTPRSSTASDSARRAGCAMRTPTWTSSSACLREAAGARRRLIATDGVFSMDGYLARLDGICDLAERHGAHGHGRRLARGRLRRPERSRHPGALRRRPTASTSSPARSARRSAAPAAATSSGRAEIVELLRQRSRPYLFSNAVAPPIVAASLAVLDLLEDGDEQRERLLRRTPSASGAMVDARLRRPARRAPDRAGHVRRGGARRSRPRSACSTTASTRSPSRTRSYRSARPHPHPDVGRPLAEDIERATEAFRAIRDD